MVFRSGNIILGALFMALVLAPGASTWTWPVDGPVLRPFVSDGDPYSGGQHRGIDIGAPSSADVRSAAAGVVSYAGRMPRQGLCLTVRTADGWSVTLVHLGSIGVPVGTQVVEGDVVGTVGPSGEPEGPEPYVHLGIRHTADPNGYVDPVTLLPPPREPAQPPPVQPPAMQPAPVQAAAIPAVERATRTPRPASRDAHARAKSSAGPDRSAPAPKRIRTRARMARPPRRPPRVGQDDVLRARAGAPVTRAQDRAPRDRVDRQRAPEPQERGAVAVEHPRPAVVETEIATTRARRHSARRYLLVPLGVVGLG